MSVLEFFQRIIAFFLIAMAIACATKIFLIPFVWAFWKLARFPFENSFNKNNIWIW